MSLRRLLPFLGKPGFKGDTTVSIATTARVSKDSEVGSYSYIGHHSFVTRASIGRYVSIANHVTIGAGEHPVDRVSTSGHFYAEPYETLTAGSCEIGADSWIAVASIIRRGVRLGIGAVVGANSFVNADVPDFAIVAGSPARLIRYRFSEAKRAAILESRWWEQDRNEAARRIGAIEAAHPEPSTR